MGGWREQLLLAALTGLAPLSSAVEITSTFTTVFQTTAVVTSSSDIAGCTVAPSMQIACSNGYYNTYGAVWQETCAASYSGGTLYSSGTGLSLRACTAACAVQPACSAALFNSAINMCYQFLGDVTITPGGPFQAAKRYVPSASPCVSTWLVTETDTITSTGEVIYTVTPTSTPTPTPSAIVSSSSTPVSPSSTPVSPSSVRVSASPSPVPPSSSPVSPSSTPSSTPLIRPSTISSSSILSTPVSSPATPSSTPLIHTTSVLTGSSSFVLSTPSSSPSGSSSTSTQSLDESSGSTQSASTYTVTTTQVHTITSCAAAVTDCPAHEQTTSLTTETITYVTTLCPENTQTTAPQATGSVETIPHTSVIQTASVSSAQVIETAAPPSRMITSTFYVTEIDVVTACPPSVHNCPAGQRSTYTTTQTVATYTTTYPVAATESAQDSQSMNASVQPVAVPSLSLAQPHVSGQGTSGKYTMSHALSSSIKAGVASSSSTQGATHAPTLNTVSGQTTSSVTTSAPGSLFTGDASKMGRFSPLFIVVAVLSALFFI